MSSVVGVGASGSALDPEFMSVLRLVCICTGFSLHIVPLITMRQVWNAGSTLNFHISTYAFALLNQSVNLWYALVRKDPALMAHRFFGVVFNAFYVYTFLTYCPPGRSADFRKTALRALALFALVAVDLQVLLPLSGYGGASGPTYFTHIAFFGAMTGIGLAAGPLATVGEVLRNKDASSLPLPFLAMVTLQCIAWTLYGHLQGDLSTFANNLVGVVLGGMQVRAHARVCVEAGRRATAPGERAAAGSGRCARTAHHSQLTVAARFPPSPQLGLIWMYPSKTPRVGNVGAEKKHEPGSSSSSGSVGAGGSSPAAGAGGSGGADEDVSESAPLAR